VNGVVSLLVLVRMYLKAICGTVEATEVESLIIRKVVRTSGRYLRRMKNYDPSQ
jgi:hypothetical protein